MQPRFLSALLATTFLGGCGDESATPPPPRPVIVKPVETAGTRALALTYPARVEAAEGTQLAFQVGGRLARVLVADGERVRRGQRLAELDDTDYQLQLREAEVALRTIGADVARRRALRDEGILAPAAVEQAEAQLASARANRDAAARQVGYAHLTAPYEGVIARRLVPAGVVVPAGEPVLRMQDADIVEVAVDVPERDAARLEFGPGLVARGRVLSSREGIELPLEYREHATAPDEASRTYRLVLRGVQPAGVNLLPGMAMQVTIDDPQPLALAPGQARVPLAAVLSDAAGAARVWTVGGGDSARPLPVRVLGVEGDHALVEGEFEAGTQVVVAGARLLREGQAVEPRIRP